MARSTRDSLFRGRVVLAQPARGEGYRVNVDALLLADFAARPGQGSRPRVAFDLGAGVGAVALALLHRDAVARAVLVEADAEAARLAEENLDANGWGKRALVVAGDVSIASGEHRAGADLVVCNPPYFEPGRGRTAKGSRGRARSGELATFIAAARLVLGRRARACFVYPARELVTFLHALRGAGLEPKRLRAVRATAGDAARVVLVEAMAAKPGGLLIERDLIEREEDGASKEMTRILSGLAGRP